jgi:hypothetical protein
VLLSLLWSISRKPGVVQRVAAVCRSCGRLVRVILCARSQEKQRRCERRRGDEGDEAGDGCSEADRVKTIDLLSNKEVVGNGWKRFSGFACSSSASFVASRGKAPADFVPRTCPENVWLKRSFGCGSARTRC